MPNWRPRMKIGADDAVEPLMQAHRSGCHQMAFDAVETDSNRS